MRSTRLMLAVMVMGLTSCTTMNTVRGPQMGPDSDPRTLMNGKPQEAKQVPLLQEVGHGSWTGPTVHPVIEPSQYHIMWAVPYTRDDMTWIGGHEVIFELAPKRFQPQPAASAQIPIATKLEEKKEEENKKKKEEKETRWPQGPNVSTTQEQPADSAQAAADRIKAIQEQFMQTGAK